MQVEASPAAVGARVRRWRVEGRSVAFVPTMGNLHRGHYSLVELARSRCDRVVASVFVNPTQFAPDEDFARYPRTLDADRAGLAEGGCDLVFTPSVETMYPCGIEATTTVHVPTLTDILEGAHRPGHFDGVTTVVTKLLAMVQPDVAVFGRKDYQQWRVIERLCLDLGMPVQIIAGAIVREADGLALSSRNQYLDPDQRRRAPKLQAALVQARQWIEAGEAVAVVEQKTTASLQQAGFMVDYVAVRRAHDLGQPAPLDHQALVILASARLGDTRLLDNLEIKLDGPR